MGPHQDPWLTDAEQTAREVARQHQQTIERLAKRGALTLRDRWVLEQGAPDQDPPIEALPRDAYALPAHARKILSPSLLARLEELLEEVRRLNDALVGLRASAAGVLLADDEATPDLRARFRRWADDFVCARLARRSPRDGGDQVRKFQRLYHELIPALETIATREEAVHCVFMTEFVDYLAFMFFLGTWADALQFDPLNGPLEHRWRVTVAPVHQHYCTEMARLHTWASTHDVRGVVQAARRRGVAPSGLQPSEIRSRLLTLASELREIRPLVIRDHNPEKLHAEVAPGLWVSWFWGGSQQLGIAPVHDDPRKRVTELHSRSFSTTLRVRHDGLMASEFAPWIDVDAILHDEPDALDVNLVVVEALHARLMDVFARIDLGRAFRHVQEDAAGAAGEEAPTQAALLATFGSDDEAASPGPAPTLPAAPEQSTRPVRVPVLRLERFLSALERLGCDVRQGKGSEVVVYRTGGKIARIGRHTRNREVPSALAQRVLHQVGVTLREWVSAIR